MAEKQDSDTQETTSSKKAKLKALVGAAATAALLSYVPQFEGTILRGYKDPIGIVTACTGHTKTAVLGRPYTKAECEDLLVTDLIAHAEGVKKCITAPLTSYQLAASVSFAFNVGVSKFCKSGIARKFNAQNYSGACEDFTKWVYAGGKVLPGLVKRREIEKDMCDGKIG
jgi:lysozyme